MLVNTEKIIGLPVLAEDGEIGEVDDVLVDENSWIVRYFVIRTGGFFSRKRVLLSPVSVRDFNKKEGVSMALTRKQIENSPDVETDKSVSRKMEEKLHNHFGWSYYWTMNINIGAPPVEPTETKTPKEIEDESRPNLRSLNELHGYAINCTDGEIGRVADYLLDDKDWHMRYLIVDTGTWFPGRKVPLSAAWIEEVSWSQKEIHVTVSKESIEQSPEWEPELSISKGFEVELFKHYGKDVERRGSVSEDKRK